jgi:2,3-bisphosphoglycerate-dependent phosphoglycerate mutase
MPHELLLIRHGQSANNALPESQRVCDPGLTETGAKQAEYLADWLVGYRPTHLFCSAFLRSLSTTKPIAERTGLTPIIRLDIFEVGGCFVGYHAGNMAPAPGMNREELTKQFPGWEVDPRIGEEGWHAGRPLETHTMAVERARDITQWLHRTISDISKTSESSRVALVIHADLKSYLIRALTSHLPSSFFDDLFPATDVPNTSVSQFTWSPSSASSGRWKLDFWCSIGHLPVEYLTR